MPRIGGGQVGGTPTNGGNTSPAATAFTGLLATLKRGHRSATIQVIGDSTGDNLTAASGTVTDEWPGVLVKRLGRDYPNYTVQERRWNDTTQGYDPETTWQTGTTGTERAAIFTRTTPGGLQYQGTAVTTNLDVQARIAPTTWVSASGGVIAARWESTTPANQRSWLLILNPDGTLGLNWSTDGVTGVGQKNSSALVTTAGATNAQPLWVRATLTLNNGATGNDVRFYTSTDGATWTQLGTTVTTAGVTTLFGGTAPYQLGSFTTGLSTPFDGRIIRIRVYGAIGGTQSLVPPIPDQWDYYSPEATVSFTGAPVLTLVNGSSSGQNVAYFDTATRRPIINQPHGQNVILLSSGHNDGTQSRQVWITNYSTWVNNIKTLLPGVPIVVLGQNPTGVGGGFNLTAQGVELRATRGAAVQQWAASQAGVYPFDAWPLLTAADTIDQLHPTAGAGSGSEKWGLGLYNAVV